MRQTLIKDGIQDRLPNLLGDGSSTYSIQASMLENFNRFGKALVGDAPYGRIMSGMIVRTAGLDVEVSSGYGITIGGNVIRLGKTYKSAGNVNKSDGNIYTVYVKYILKTRGASPVAQGGHDANFSIPPSPRPVIQDQVGARGEDDPETGYIVYFNSGATINVTDNDLYVGTIQYSMEGSELKEYITRQNDLNSTVDYAYSKEVGVQFYGTTNDCTDTSCINTTMTQDMFLIDINGRSRIRSMSVLRYYPQTGTIRTSNPDDYSMRMTIFGVQQGGGLVALASNIMVPESVQNYNFYDIQINSIINYPGVIGLAFGFTITATSSLFTSLGSAATTFGRGIINCVIEKLT